MTQTEKAERRVRVFEACALIATSVDELLKAYKDAIEIIEAL